MLEQLTNYVYYLPAEATTDRPILGVVRGSRYTLVIDGGNSEAHARKLQHAISKKFGAEHFGDADVNFVAVTHHHWDHVFGLDAWDAPVLAEQRIATQLEYLSTLTWDDAALNARVVDGTEVTFCRNMIQAELPETPQNPRQVIVRLADITFTDAITLDLGGVCCDVVHVGGEHAPDSCVVYVYEVDTSSDDNNATHDATKPAAQRNSVLFLGDCTYQNFYNGHSEASYDMQQLQSLLTRLAKFPATWYVTSHNEAAQDAPRFRQEMEQLTAIGITVEAHGFDGDLVLEMLSRRYGLRSTEDTRELVRMFQVGLRLRQQQSQDTI